MYVLWPARDRWSSAVINLLTYLIYVCFCLCMHVYNTFTVMLHISVFTFMFSLSNQGVSWPSETCHGFPRCRTVAQISSRKMRGYCSLFRWPSIALMWFSNVFYSREYACRWHAIFLKSECFKWNEARKLVMVLVNITSNCTHLLYTIHIKWKL